MDRYVDKRFFNDVVFYWDKIVDNQPRRNLLKDRDSMFAEYLRDFNIEVEHVEFDREDINISYGVYIIEYGFCSGPEFEIIINDFDHELFAKLSEQKIPVIIWCPQEKDEYISEYDTEIRKLATMIRDAHDCIVLIGGNEYRQNNSVLDTIYYLRYYFTIFDTYFMTGALKENFKFDYLKDKTYKKHFTCVNNVLRSGKLHLLSKLKEEGLLEDNNVSLLHVVPGIRHDSLRQMIEQTTYEYNEKYNVWNRINMFLNDHFPFDGKPAKKPLVIDRKREDYECWAFLHDGDNYMGGLRPAFDESVFTVVNETHSWPEREICITEKIFIPMAFNMPFIVNAPAHYLKCLRRLGYHTFPELFDESYDDIEDCIERIEFIAEEIKRVCNIPFDELKEKLDCPRIKQKLVHNQKLLQNSELHQTRIIKLLNYLRTTVETYKEA